MMPAYFENGEKCAGSKEFELASLQDFDAKEMYLRPKHRSVSFQKRRQCSVFLIFECSHVAVSEMCRLELSFQSLPSSKSAGKKRASFV